MDDNYNSSNINSIYPKNENDLNSAFTILLSMENLIKSKNEISFNIHPFNEKCKENVILQENSRIYPLHYTDKTPYSFNALYNAVFKEGCLCILALAKEKNPDHLYYAAVEDIKENNIVISSSTQKKYTITGQDNIRFILKFKREYRIISPINNTGIAAAAFLSGGNCFKYNSKTCLENYKNFGKWFDIPPSQMVRTHQKHTDEIQIISIKNAGDGIIRDGTSTAYDGMITDTPGIMMCIFTADCVPVFILDPNKKAAGIVHSGWRGTAKKISANAVRKMTETYGTDPKDLIVALGPYNCKKCYEVDKPLMQDFAAKFSQKRIETFFTKKNNSDKYLLDMGLAIKYTLEEAGVPTANIHDENHCTFHTDEYASWRKSKNADRHIISGIVLR